MARMSSALLGTALLALAMGLSGCQKDLQVPSYEIKIEGQEEEQDTLDPATWERSSAAPQTIVQDG